MNLYDPPRLIPEALALIKHFEGCFLEAYRDPVGVMTIGYGHTADVKRGMSITADEAERLLAEDLNIAQADVFHHVKVPLNDNEFGALVSLAFNIGGPALAKSTLTQRLNRGDRNAAAQEFARFVNGHVGGRRVTLRGLVLRRRAEREFFQTPPGQLVRDGKMMLAGRTIPVDHPSNDVAHVGPPPPPPHYVPQTARDFAQAEIREIAPAAGPDRRASLAALISLGTGAAVGAVPAADTPASDAFVDTVSRLWQQSGGADIFPAQTAWLHWLEAFRSSVSQIYHGQNWEELFAYAAAFIQSHEGLIVLLITVALIFLRLAIGGLFSAR